MLQNISQGLGLGLILWNGTHSGQTTWKFCTQTYFKKWMGRHGLDYPGSRQGQVVGSYGCGSEPFEFHKKQGTSLLVEDLLASEEGLCAVEFVSH